MIAREHNVVVIPASEPESRGGDAELNSDPLAETGHTSGVVPGSPRAGAAGVPRPPLSPDLNSRPGAVRVAAPSTARLSWSLTGSSAGPPGVSSADDRGSGWVPVGFADFKSVGPGPSVGVVGSTPSRSRHAKAVADTRYQAWSATVYHSGTNILQEVTTSSNVVVSSRRQGQPDAAGWEL